jgi:uncharacterized protein
MNISGSQTFPLSATKTYEMLINPQVLLRTLPGLKSMKEIKDHTYQAHIEIGVAGLTSSYHGYIQLRDLHPPTEYTLTVDGEGPMGGLQATVLVKIAALSKNSATVDYEGTIDVHGKIAGLGQRVLSTVASTLVHQFFRNLLKEGEAPKGIRDPLKKRATTAKPIPLKTPKKSQTNLKKKPIPTKKAP